MTGLLEPVGADLRRAREDRRGERRGALRTIANGYGLQALFVYRLGRWLRTASRWSMRWALAPLLWPAYGLLAWLVRALYDIRLELSADIGPGLLVYHFGGIHLRDCRLGERCVLHQEVVVGPGEEGQGGPALGDGVWIGPLATITGPIRIGSGATIGAGAVVARDVPDRSLVLGAPARVVQPNYDNSELE